MVLQGVAMKNITFEKDVNEKSEKEHIEWLRIWCEDTNDNQLPRVALIGDSITEGYYQCVKRMLKGTATVDYLATSYSVKSDIYCEVIRKFLMDSKYEVVHYNYGLHAFSVDRKEYRACCKKVLQFIPANSKIIVATTTTVLDESLEKEDLHWKDKVLERNDEILDIAKELNVDVDDLNQVCRTFDSFKRNKDGVHFTDAGYQILAQSVVNCVKNTMKNNVQLNNKGSI